MTDTRWVMQGACGRFDPELFFPDPGNTKQAKVAKAVCKHCPVLVECLQHALVTYRKGVWGGTTDLERERIRRNAKRRRERAAKRAAA